MEAALHPWNKLLQPLLRLAGACSGASKELQRYELAGSGDLVVSLSGEPGLLAVVEVPDSLSPSDAMAGGHLVQPGRSATIEHVDVFGVLLLVATKICDVSS